MISDQRRKKHPHSSSSARQGMKYSDRFLTFFPGNQTWEEKSFTRFREKMRNTFFSKIFLRESEGGGICHSDEFASSKA